MDWKTQLDQDCRRVEAYLKDLMDLARLSDENQVLLDAMKYSLFAGGKRLRPILALAAYRIFGSEEALLLPYACGLEMIHTYSLIHDDLPAMDDDDYRRGKPTNHKVYGEGLAILAGDGLLNHAFQIMLADAVLQADPRPFLRAIYEISRAAGVNGMIGGQTADLLAEGKEITSQTLEYIHRHKTGALITASLKIGTILGGASLQDLEKIEAAGCHLGLAFQIQDDILDITGDPGKMGKNTGSDAAHQKATYPALYGLEESGKQVLFHTEKLSDLLSGYGERARFLIELSHHLISREA